MRAAVGLCTASVVFFALQSVPTLVAGKAASSKASEGRLVTGDGGKTVDLPLEHTDVRIHIDGFVADATVTQTFHNPYDRPIEAVYLFPLPTRAAVHHLQIKLGERTIKGSIARRQEAERVYEEARDKGHVAALLTQERPNLFTQSVANIEPGARIQVTLRYVQPLEYEDGGYEVVFPMVAGPRYVPGTARQSSRIQPARLPPGMRSSHDISLAVAIDAGVPIRAIASASHKLRIEHEAGAPSRARVTIAASDSIPNKDFILRYAVAGDKPEFAVLSHRDAGKGSFFLLAQPPRARELPGPREIIFVLDTSSSMSGAPLAKAKELVRRVLRGLRRDDTYQIVRFADTVSALGPAPIANKPRNIRPTLAWLDALDARGSTEMMSGIRAALAVPHDPHRLRIMVFVTDGYIGNEDEILAMVQGSLGESRLFSFGVGSAVNRYLLEEMALLGRGDVQIVRPDEDTRAAVQRFHDRIDKPVLTDVRIDWNGLAVRDVVPARVPDLFSGQPLIVSGHYERGGAATITVHGKRAGRAVRFDVPVTLPERSVERPAVATVWARARIAELSRALLRAKEQRHEDEIVALALEHELMSPYTAFVAVDESDVIDTGGRIQVMVPVEIPESVSNASAGIGGFGGGIGAGGGGIGYGTLSIGAAASGSGYGASVGVASHSGAVGYGRATAMSSASARPQVTLGAPSVTGNLDKSLVRRYLRRDKNNFRYCYDKQLMATPDLSGAITIELVINGQGAVVQARHVGSTDHAELAACMTRYAQAIVFPKSRTDPSSVVKVRFSIAFGLPPARGDKQ